MFTKLLEALKATRRTIVFTEGPDARILEATDRLLKEDLMDVILPMRSRTPLTTTVQSSMKTATLPTGGPSRITPRSSRSACRLRTGTTGRRSAPAFRAAAC